MILKGSSFAINKELPEKQSGLFIISLKGELRKLSEQITRLDSELSQLSNRAQQAREEAQKAENGLERAKIDIKKVRSATEYKYKYEAYQVYLHTLKNYGFWVIMSLPCSSF